MGVSNKKLTPATLAAALSAASRKERKFSRNNVPRKAQSSNQCLQKLNNLKIEVFKY